MDRYYEFIIKINEIMLPIRNRNEVLDVFDMNKWLYNILEFYKNNDIDIKYEDLYNFHQDNISNKDKRNNILNKYMKVFYDNIDNLESYEFIKLLFSYDDLSIDNDNDIINPIYEEINIMINNLNNRHINIFNRKLLELEKEYQDLSIPKDLFFYHKINDLKLYVEKIIDSNIKKR